MNTEIYTVLLLLCGATASAWLLHWLIGVALRRAAHRFARRIASIAASFPSFKKVLFDWSGNALRTLVWTLYCLFVVVLLPQTRAQLDSVGERLPYFGTRVAAWLLDQGVVAVVIIVATIFLMRFAAALIKTGFELFERRALDQGEAAARRRSRTLATIFRGAAQSVICFIGLMVGLQQLGVSVAPILAGAGVVGIAVGFGAQSLIKDLFAGFLILLEDQYSVGDSIKIGETTGTVEGLTLRVTRVRALDGALTTIPNGTITTVSNLSKDWSRAVLDLEIDYEEDVERAMHVALETAYRLHAELPAEIIEEPSMLGIDKLTHNGIVLRLTVKTVAGKQADVSRELRRRLKSALDQAGIKAPQQLVMKT